MCGRELPVVLHWLSNTTKVSASGCLRSLAGINSRHESRGKSSHENVRSERKELTSISTEEMEKNLWLKMGKPNPVLFLISPGVLAG